MMIDFGDDGAPSAHFAADGHDQGKAHFTFDFGTIEAEQANVAAGLGTGSVQWQSGTALAHALSDAKKAGIGPASRLSQLRAIELGCGCAALPAVVAAAAGASTIASDVSALVPLLQENIRRYTQDSSVSETGRRAIGENLTAQALDWSSEAELRELAASPHGYDLVLCADCVDESDRLLDALVEAISASLAPAGCALIATGARSQRLLSLFLSSLAASGLVVTELTNGLTPLPAEASERARQGDDTRFFAATWPDVEAGRAARARIAQRGSGEALHACDSSASSAVASNGPEQAEDAKVQAEVMDAMGAMLQQLLLIQAATNERERDAQYNVLQSMVEAASVGGAADGDEGAAPAAPAIAPAAAPIATSTVSEVQGILGRPAAGAWAFGQTRLVDIPLAGGVTIVVEQSLDGPMPLEADGTNRRIWPTACVLSTYLSLHPRLVRGKRIVELGSGSGAVGLACAALGASFVAITDVEDALPLIRENVKRNSAVVEAGQGGGGGGGAGVEVKPCRWGNAAHIAALLEGGRYDVVVACETVYKQCEEVLAAHVDTQKQLMATPSGISLLAYEYRGELFDDMVFFDAANEAFECEPLSLRPYEGKLEDEEDEDSRWLYTYTHKAD